MGSLQHLLTILLLAVSIRISNGFSLRQKPNQAGIRLRVVNPPSHSQAILPALPKIDWALQATTVNGDDNLSRDVGKTIMKSLGMLSALAWIAISVKALSYHPDPKFADCTLRHNILTMSQAFAFPLPVGFAAVSSSASTDPVLCPMSLALALAVASIWLAGSSLWAPKFAFGYDLYSPSLKVASGLIHLATAVVGLGQWFQKGAHDDTPIESKPNGVSKLWGICSIGLLWFAICPILAPYPLATVPTILGKRLSRPASAFTFLGAALAYCLRRAELRGNCQSKHVIRAKRGLLMGSSLHLTLIALKLIGVDGGGFLLPGNGLWEVYPAMLAVPFATASSLLVHLLVCVAATR